MLVIRESEGEVELSASPDELRGICKSIVALLSSTDSFAQFPAAQATSAPYRRCLAGACIRRSSGKTLASVAGDLLVVEGADESLAAFASWFNVPREPRPGYHAHFEPLPEDPWHSSESVALVVAVA